MSERIIRTLLAGSALVLAPAAASAAEPAAEIKVGLGIEKMEIKDAAETFKVDPGTKIFAWTRVSGCEGASVSITFEKDGKAVFSKDLDVPRSPYRTNACRTFRAGDGGAWTVKVATKDGKDLGSTKFTVDVK